MTYAFVFPGQGSQYIGMGAALAESFAEAKAVFQEIDDALSHNLSAIMFNGDEADLNLTENTQPALMGVSMAVIRVLEKQGGLNISQTCDYMAGHSLGEYAALTASGSLSLADTARLLKLRGMAMQDAVPVGKGSMAAILGLTFDDVKTLAQKASAHGVCDIANDNCDGQVVISGDTKAVEAGIALAKEAGAKRAVLLPVSAPFHCSLMQPAADAMQRALEETTIKSPMVPIVTNITADAVTEPSQLKSLLVDQVTGMVRWRESVLWMRDHGVTALAEIGAGKVLSGLTRRIDKDIPCTPVETPAQIEAFLETLNA